MKLENLLVFATKNGATELRVTADGPIEIQVAGETRRVNLPPMRAKDFDEMVTERLGAEAREQLRFSGRCEAMLEVAGIGRVRTLAEPGKARFVLADAQEAPPRAGASRAPGAVPTFMERLRRLFGGK